MTWINLGDPKPWSEPRLYTPVEWPALGSHVLPSPMPFPSSDRSMASVVLSRRSSHTFGPLTDSDLSALLWYSSKASDTKTSPMGFSLSRRPVPSAGAIHPVHVVCRLPDHPSWYRYDPYRHALADLGNKAELTGLGHKVGEMVPPATATILLFVAEPQKTLAKYENGCSLIWRDAGVLIGHLALLSEGLNLSYCPLGITGEPWAGSLDSQGRLVGVGVALVGTRAHET